MEGNKRFLIGDTRISSLTNQARRLEVAGDQKPFAIILGCADSRVPAEVIFDQGLGDLFVIRIAGNIIAPSQIGSVEFAAGYFGTPLVVVLGHSFCGAVQATLDEVTGKSSNISKNLASITNRIKPAVEYVLLKSDCQDPFYLLREAVRENIRRSVQNLCNGSEIITDLINQKQLLVVGAEYFLETGEVDFFEGIPAF
jgi:carbonic anhydrase